MSMTDEKLIEIRERTLKRIPLDAASQQLDKYEMRDHLDAAFREVVAVVREDNERLRRRRTYRGTLREWEDLQP